MIGDVSALIISIGTDDFYANAIKFMEAQCAASHIAIFSISAKSDPIMICSNFHNQSIQENISHQEQIDCSEIFNSPQSNDMSHAIHDKTDNSEKLAFSIYLNSIFPGINIHEEISEFSRFSDGTMISVSIAIDARSAIGIGDLKEKFSEFRSIVSASIEKHTKMRLDRAKDIDESPAALDLHRVKSLFGKSVLSNREQEAVRLLLSGYRVSAVAEKMKISTGTAKNYCKAIYRKLDINSKGELFSLFFEAGCTTVNSADDDPLRIYEARPQAAKTNMVNAYRFQTPEIVAHRT